MRVISCNKGDRKQVKWRGKTIETGIFKFPVEDSIHLGFEDVEGDQVVDRKYHGGTDKACYCYSADHYPFWKEKYSDLDWDYGMFGENLTVEGLNEHELFLGDQYQIGEAIVAISEPRQPCFKLGIRFGTQAILKPFVSSSFCGTYLRVVKQGEVKAGDEFKLHTSHPEKLSIAENYRLIYSNDKEDIQRIQEILKSSIITSDIVNNLEKRLKVLEG